jgi:hypothetical protein
MEERRFIKVDTYKGSIEHMYRFKFMNGDEKHFSIKLDKKTLNLMNSNNIKRPEWAKLKNFKCSICPLNEKEYKYCPVAENIAYIVDNFKDYISYEKVEVFVETENRKISKRTNLQEGIASLLGSHMVASGCPILGKLKPMIRVHLPFSTLDERKYRVLTMYLFAQYFKYKKGENPDWDFKDLLSIFDKVRIVNKNICDRLSEIKIQDSTINALITLDSFAFYTSFQISSDMLDTLEPSFNAYVEDTAFPKSED